MKNLQKETWELKTLEEIATEIYSGANVTREQLGTGNYPAIKAGDISSKLNIYFEECVSFVDSNLIKRKKYFENGDLLVSNISNKWETVGKAVSYLGNEKCLAGLGVTVIKHSQNPKYLAFALSSDFCRSQVHKETIKGTVFNFWKEKIQQVKIPLPPLEEQERIVSILDKFHTICEDIEEGIPKLIKDVTKQYEYYRDQIFSK